MNDKYNNKNNFITCRCENSLLCHLYKILHAGNKLIRNVGIILRII
jgi:hypothetical protein